MKQAILLGVGLNVAASVPLILAQEALATDHTADTANFLRQSAGLKSGHVQATKPQSLMVQSQAQSSVKARNSYSNNFSSLKAIDTRMAMSDDGVKLRPFVAGRKLPRKSDFGSQRLATQMPQLDDNNGGRLAGTVNMQYNTPSQESYSTPGYGSISNSGGFADNNSGYSNHTAINLVKQEASRRLKQATQAVARFDRKAMPRVMPGQQMVTPGQVGLPCANQAVVTPNNGNGAGPSEEEWTQMAKAVGQHQDIQVAAENEELENMAKQLKGDFAAPEFGAPDQSHVSAAGPPPFPLNLIPEASLKQFIGGKSHGPVGGLGSPTIGSGSAGSAGSSMAAGNRPAPAYFGSWRQGQGAATATNNKSHGQATGFHTFLNSGNSGSGSYTSSAFKQYSPVALRNSKRLAPKSAAVISGKATQIAKAPAVKNAVMATYGDYQ